ncbi:preprotein translocase subunit SecG [Mesoplasma entomophilum]|uniref:Protein-export membrane protein SecG n=1 Tax=Mesoplasma entomophilum TaxID=2149 RepID=A0A3S5XZJ6_9MOLU|nr:preprotein translocase subunit SecG [Mesoplasma entomophilum]ATQ35231.1 preprotein translocase subunit SecG [Mesoplasma entomophilum]ATZ19179.1 preprotein translocase subunit SecG [Mesoplasma entomophilum]AVN60089.1 preprotein translocase subunit SecG [Mesoplasma entomophilum]
MNSSTAQIIILVIEIVAMVVSIIMILIGIFQNKNSQSGLSALNGGNDELFSNSKERGLDKTLSTWMMTLGIIFFVVALAACILTNMYL